MRFVGFNLSNYNSSDQQLRLNYLKTIRQRIDLCHVSPRFSDDLRLRFNRTIGRSTCCHVTWAIIKSNLNKKKILNSKKF